MQDCVCPSPILLIRLVKVKENTAVNWFIALSVISTVCLINSSSLSIAVHLCLLPDAGQFAGSIGGRSDAVSQICSSKWSDEVHQAPIRTSLNSLSEIFCTLLNGLKCERVLLDKQRETRSDWPRIGFSSPAFDDSFECLSYELFSDQWLKAVIKESTDSRDGSLENQNVAYASKGYFEIKMFNILWDEERICALKNCFVV